MRLTTGLPNSCVNSSKFFSNIALWNNSFYFGSKLTFSLDLSSLVYSAEEVAPIMGARVVELLRVRDSILGKDWVVLDLAMLRLRLAIDILFR